jgi:hypothetical protein
MREIKTAVFLMKHITFFWNNDIVQRELKSAYPEEEMSISQKVKFLEEIIERYERKYSSLYEGKEGLEFDIFFDDYPLYIADPEFATTFNIGDSISLNSDSWDRSFFTEEYIEENKQTMYRLFIESFIWNKAYQRLLIVGKRFSIGNSTLYFDVVLI